MSGPNPFSLSNAPEHNLVSKVVSVIGTGVHYDVAVDLVDIDTAYMRQVGSTGHPVQQEYVTNLGSTGNPVTQAYIAQMGSSGASGNAYFNDIHVGGNIYWHHFVPDIVGGSGSSGGYTPVGGTGIHVDLDGYTATVYSNLVAGPGIGLTLTSNDWNIRNTGILGVTGSTFVNVSYTNPQYPVISFAGVTGIQGISGGTGIAVNNADPLNPVISYKGITGIAAGSNVVIDFITNPYVPIISAAGGSGGALPSGPPGELIYFTSTGIAASPNLVYNGTVLHTPSTTIQTPGQTGQIRLETSGPDSYISSGSIPTPGSGNLLNIGPIGTGNTGIYPVVVVDTTNHYVGINKVPTVELDVVGKTRLTGVTLEYGITGINPISGSALLAPSTQYIIYGWGAGGNGNNGVGGAGGYAEVQLATGSTGHTLSWAQMFGGESGGGNAMVVSYAGVTFLWIPGGGAGISGGTGAAAGEVQGLPLPEGGISAPGTAGATASYTVTGNWVYTTLAGATLPPGEVFNGGTIGGTFATVGATGGMTFTFQPGGQTIAQFMSSAGTTYRVPPGVTLTINSNFASFPNSTFDSLSNALSAVPDDTYILVNGGTGTTNIGTGTAIYNGWPTVTVPNDFYHAQLNTGTTGIHTSSGQVIWESGSLTIPVSGATYDWFFTYGAGITEISANQVITLGPSVSVLFPYVLPTIPSGSIATETVQNVPAGSTITVANRRLVNTGNYATGNTGTQYGGGGFTGGGSPALVTVLPDGTTLGLNIPGNMPAGGGAGSWNILSSVPDAVITPAYTIGGSGPNPYTGTYNPLGTFGSGGITGAGSAGGLVLNGISSDPIKSLTATGLSQFEYVNISNNCYIQETAILRINASAQLQCAGQATFYGQLVAAGGSTVNFGATSNVILPGGVWMTDGAGNSRMLWGFSGNNATYFQSPNGYIFHNDLGSVGLITIDNSGNLTATGNISGNDIIARSDIRVKDNIQTIDSALDKVLKMRGVYFTKKNEKGRRTGLIAQEVEEILPEVVYTDDTEDKLKSVSYGSIVGLLIEAIKEQQETINDLKSRLSHLE